MTESILRNCSPAVFRTGMSENHDGERDHKPLNNSIQFLYFYSENMIYPQRLREKPLGVHSREARVEVEV